MPLIGRDEFPLRLVKTVGLQHCQRASAEKLGAADLHAASKPVETFHQVVIELYENLLAWHG